MKNKNQIEESMKQMNDEDYYKKKYKEAKIIIREKDKIIEELKKNLECF